MGKMSVLDVKTMDLTRTLFLRYSYSTHEHIATELWDLEKRTIIRVINFIGR
jgi:hypothetical protein